MRPRKKRGKEMNLTAFDFVMLAIFIVVVVKVTLSGFISEFFSKASVILGAVVAIVFYRRLAPFVMEYLGKGVYVYAVAFLLLFLAGYAVVKIVQKIVGSATQNETVDNLDHAFGFFLGAVEGAICILVVLIILRSIPFFDLSFVTTGSFIAKLFDPLVTIAPGSISGILPVLP
jgi:membrane protein required for colicin V production